MAKRFKRFRKRASRMFTKTRRGSKKSSSVNPLMLTGMAGVYGMFDNQIDNAVSPITNMIPFGSDYKKPVAKGVIAYMVAKKSKGIIKTGALAVLTVEGFKAGKIAGGQFLGNSSNNNDF